MRAISIILIATMTGCATLHLPDYHANSFQSYSNSIVKNNVGVAIEPLTDSAKIKQYFGTDLRTTGILPVFMLVENRGDRSFLLSKEKIVLVTDESNNSLVENSSETVSSTLASTLGIMAVPAIVVAPIIAVPLMPLAAKLGSDVEEVRHNLAVKEFRSKTVSPGTNAQGFMYFSLPKTYTTLKRLRVQIPITKTPGNKKQIIEMPLI